MPILQLTHAFLVDRETSASHPIRHNTMAAARHDRLRVELHTMQRQRRMPHGHHHPRIRPTGHHQLLRQRRLIYRQRVISRHRHGIRQTTHHTRTVMPHRRRLPVQQLVRTDNRTAQSLGQRLMPQTHTQHRDLMADTCFDQRNRLTCRRRSPRPRRNQHAVETLNNRPARGPILRGIHQTVVVVTPHRARLPQLPDVLHKVVYKTVIIIDDENPHTGNTNGTPNPQRSYLAITGPTCY